MESDDNKIVYRNSSGREISAHPDSLLGLEIIAILESRRRLQRELGPIPGSDSQHQVYEKPQNYE